MDKTAARLREDASAIDVSISPELDERIQASLQGIAPEPQGQPSPPSRQPWFWWASSLTGAAAVFAVVAIVNLPGSGPEDVDPTVPQPVGNPTALLPPISWQVETAVLTSPLEQEIEDLQSDLRKAEEALKRDIEAVF